jgi:SOS response regulatory protein OraA/RecX
MRDHPDHLDKPGGPADGENDPPADPEAVARAICLRLLTMRDRSRGELAAAMARKNVPDKVAAKVLDRFTEIGLINDDALAQSMVEVDHHGRGLSARAVGVRMRRRGVAEPAIQVALAQVDPDSELEAARRLARRKLVSLRNLDSTVQARRLFGLLARRGYGAGMASRVIREVMAERGEGLSEGSADELAQAVE